MRKLCILLIIYFVIILSSCSYYNSTLEAKATLDNILLVKTSSEVTKNKQKKDLLKKALDEDLTKIFQGYDIDTNKTILDYHNTQIDLPRFVDINNVTIIKYDEIEKIDFNIIEIVNNRYKLQVDIDIKVNVIPTNIFNTKYMYLEKDNYYLDNGTELDTEAIDQYKINANYYVDYIFEDNEFYLNSILENSDLFISEQKKYKKENNSFINRIAYKDNPNEDEIKIVEEFFDNFFSQDYHNFSYFKSIQNSSFESITKYYDEILSAKLLVLLEEDSFKDNFPISICPIRDDIIGIKKLGKVNFSSYIYSSLNNQKYYLEIPVTITYSDNTNKDMIYIYIVELTNKHSMNRISSLEYIHNLPKY